jgi:hypothetical protein
LQSPTNAESFSNYNTFSYYPSELGNLPKVRLCKFEPVTGSNLSIVSYNASVVKTDIVWAVRFKNNKNIFKSRLVVWW